MNSQDIINIVSELNAAAYKAQEHLGLQITPFTYLTDADEDYVCFLEKCIWSTIDGTPEDLPALRKLLADEIEAYFESIKAAMAVDYRALLAPGTERP